MPRQRSNHRNSREKAGKLTAESRANVSLIDVSERRLSEKKDETARLHTQKMEAIGALAGGIAHDFNNILAVIIGFTEMVIEDVSDNPDVKHKMEQILKAGIRGRDLVRQIVAFSRKGEGERKEVNLGTLVRETHALLRASLPSTIQMPLVITSEDDCILADPAEVQQALMHIATNAAYAMREDGGELMIKLSSVNFPEGSLFPDPGLEQGIYLKLTVKDTGTGMTEEVQQRIFEPFFSTKERGKGTGMGLAMVYGVVKGHGGAIRVQSEVGQGSTFEVFLPRARRKEAAKEKIIASALPTGTERILFVDDEKLLVEMAHGMLKGLGYDVTVAKHGSEAWKLFIADPMRFDLVITDQTMPDVTGVTLAQQMLKVRQKMPIIICTGYSEFVSAEKAKALGIRAFVMKPIARKDMAQTVRKVLDESNAG
jgi:signal transduction histidine kinase/ActR/RegA family two-component response regulator